MIVGKNIDERDIFNYVFFRNLLDEEKLKYLEKNEHNFERIEFYKNMKQEIRGPVDQEIKEKLAAKSAVYKTLKIISLYPVDEKIEKKPSEVPILAAASAPEEAKVSAQTFIDEDKTFLIRLLRIKNITKIFTLPITHTDIESFQITLHPEGNTFTVQTNEPLEIEGKHNVESINVELG